MKSMFASFPKPGRVGEPCFFIDWDDTLLPTTYLLTNKGSHVSLEHIQIVKQLLMNALAYSLDRVFIVTSSQQGWVMATCKRYMPELCDLIRRCRIIHTFMQTSKAPAMRIVLKTLRDHNPGRTFQAFLIGNADGDIAPAQMILSEGHCPLVKTCKLVDIPGAEELRQQLVVLNMNLRKMISHGVNKAYRLKYAQKEAVAECVCRKNSGMSDRTVASQISTTICGDLGYERDLQLYSVVDVKA